MLQLTCQPMFAEMVLVLLVDWTWRSQTLLVHGHPNGGRPKSVCFDVLIDCFDVFSGKTLPNLNDTVSTGKRQQCSSYSWSLFTSIGAL